MYFPYGKNKGADQLRGYREADLRLCFRICKKLVFSQQGSYISELDSPPHLSYIYMMRLLLKDDTGWLLSNIWKDDAVSTSLYEPHHEKTCILGCQPGPTQTGTDGYRLEILDIGSRGIVLSMQ